MQGLRDGEPAGRHPSVSGSDSNELLGLLGVLGMELHHGSLTCGIAHSKDVPPSLGPALVGGADAPCVVLVSGAKLVVHEEELAKLLVVVMAVRLIT